MHHLSVKFKGMHQNEKALEAASFSPIQQRRNDAFTPFFQVYPKPSNQSVGAVCCRKQVKGSAYLPGHSR